MLDFRALYKIMSGGVYGGLALGLRHVKTSDFLNAQNLRDAIQYRIPGAEEGVLARTIYGTIQSEDEETGVIHLVGDVVPYTVDFIPCTLEVWNELGSGGFISGYKSLIKYMKTTNHLWMHYNDMFPAPWWTKEYKYGDGVI